MNYQQGVIEVAIAENGYVLTAMTQRDFGERRVYVANTTEEAQSKLAEAIIWLAAEHSKHMAYAVAPPTPLGIEKGVPL